MFMRSVPRVPCAPVVLRCRCALPVPWVRCVIARAMHVCMYVRFLQRMRCTPCLAWEALVPSVMRMPRARVPFVLCPAQAARRVHGVRVLRVG